MQKMRAIFKTNIKKSVQIENNNETKEMLDETGKF